MAWSLGTIQGFERASVTLTVSLDPSLLGGQGIVAHVLYTEQRENYADIDRAVKKYPFDPRRAEQLMAEAGFARGRDGFFASAAGL